LKGLAHEVQGLRIDAICGLYAIRKLSSRLDSHLMQLDGCLEVRLKRA